MKKGTVCILLALVMILSLFAACGGAAAPAESAGAGDSAAAAESTAAAPAEAPAAAEAEPADASAEEDAEASAVEAEPAEEEWEEVTYELPLTEEPLTYTMFCNANPTSTGLERKDNMTFQELQNRTNIFFDITEVSPFAYTEQFMLMVAGGDWSDIMLNVRSTYTGGLAAALNEEVILDLEPLKEYFPNYYHLITSDPKIYRDVTLGDGEIAAFYTIAEKAADLSAGLFMRGDWLDKLNLDSPQTVDQYYDALSAMHNEYGACMHLPTNGVLSDQAVMSAYEVTGFFIDAGFFQSFQPYTVQNDKVICGFQQEGFREYMKTINKWYAEGLIDQDFMSSTSNSNYLGDGSDNVAALLNGKYCMWGDPAAYVAKYTGAPDPDFEARPTMLPTLEEGDTVKCGENLSRVNLDYCSLSATCHDPEVLLQYYDYGFTEEGCMLLNWGIEGVTYTTNPDGTHQYTDLILNHEGYNTLNEATAAYLGGSCTFGLYENSRALLTDEQLKCYEVWGSNFTGEYAIPGSMTMTTAESEEWGAITADLVTYLNQNVAQFIIGNKDPNDDKQWDAFLSDIEGLGIDRCNEIEQAVYDRWARIGG